MVEHFLAWDKSALYFLNVTMGHPIADMFWLTITQLHKTPWFIYFVAPVGLALFIYRWRLDAVRVLLMVAMTVAVTDNIASRAIKKTVERPRPYNTSDVSVWIRRVGVAHSYSFPSNHAANAFAAAYILGWYFYRRRHMFYALATLIAISRCTLGVHYPSDVIAGALLGIFVGYLVAFLILRNVRWLWLHNSVSITNAESWTWSSRIRRLEEP